MRILLQIRRVFCIIKINTYAGVRIPIADVIESVLKEWMVYSRSEEES